MSKRTEKIFEIVFGFFGIVLVLGFYIGLGYLIYQYWATIYESVAGLIDLHSRSYFKGCMFALIALTIGLLLFKLRSSARIHYGLTEIMFGMLSVLATTSPIGQSGNSIQVLQIGAGIYIVVRGLDNLKIGLDAAPTHSMWGLWNLVFSNNDRKHWLRNVLGMRLRGQKSE